MLTFPQYIGTVTEADEFGILRSKPVTVQDMAARERKAELEHRENLAFYNGLLARLKAPELPTGERPDPSDPDYIAKRTVYRKGTDAEREAVLADPTRRYFRAVILGNVDSVARLIENGIVKMWRLDSWGVLWLQKIM